MFKILTFLFIPIITINLFVVKCNSTSIIENFADDLFELSIIHMNDFHACFEPIGSESLRCDPAREECFGGYARAVTVINDLLSTTNNGIYLNAGDNFQGTIWYNIGRWNVTKYFLNMLPADAITLGNHDFDNDIEGVVPFLKELDSPVVVCNIDDTDEPTMQGEYQKSIVIERSGRQIGIIGVILSTTNSIAATGNLRFLNESESIAAEAEILKEQGVNIIIVLSHCGLDVDKEIARQLGNQIDVIVGGHSHTLMFNGTAPGNFYAQDYYPSIENGVLIVQASAYTAFIGNLNVQFDDEGNWVSYSGAPVYLSADIIQDPDVVRELQPWKEIIDKEAAIVVGVTKVPLVRTGCYNNECNLGSFLTDGFVDYFITEAGPDEWTSASIAITNAGGIRQNLAVGELDYGSLISVIPFENTLDTVDLLGIHLLETLEYSVSRSYDEEIFSGIAMLQVSGLKIVYNVSNPVGSRVVSADVLCNKCDIPEYLPLNVDQWYRVVVPSFIRGGGDDFTMISDNYENLKIGPVDINVIVNYVSKRSEICLADANGRIQVLT